MEPAGPGARRELAVSWDQVSVSSDSEEASDRGVGGGLLPFASTAGPGAGRAGALRCALVASAALALALTAGAALAAAPRRPGRAAAAPPLRGSGGELVAYAEDPGSAAVPTTWTSTTSVPFRQSSQDWPSLFCWLVSQTVGGQELNRVQGWWEEKLVWEMLMQKVGIFACNEFAVFTDKKAKVSEFGQWGWPYVPDNYTAKPGEIISWALGSTQTSKNSDSSPSNTWVFVAAWKALGTSGVLDKHHWVIKQDPDAVVLPWRIRWHANQWPSKDGKLPMFIKNCQTFHSMQGPLEIFSISLVKAMLPNIDNCGQGAAGEDGKMEKCAQQFGQAYMDGTALDDKYCMHMEPQCKDGNKIAFHPLKEIPNFRRCFEDTMNAEQQYSSNHPAR